MELMDVEIKLREILLLVFGFDHIDEIEPDHSLFDDLGAESLDFVEIMWMIEQNFGVVLKASELVIRDSTEPGDDLFKEDKLTAEGAVLLQRQFPHSTDKITPGLSKVAVFRLMTVRDLAVLIQAKLSKVGWPC